MNMDNGSTRTEISPYINMCQTDPTWLVLLRVKSPSIHAESYSKSYWDFEGVVPPSSGNRSPRNMLQTTIKAARRGSLTLWHRSFTFNSNKSPTWCNSFSVYYPDVCLQLNIFGRFPAHHQELSDYSGSLWFYLRIVVTVVLCSWSGRPA